MSENTDVRTGAGVEQREGWFVRTAGRIGDLGSPFYEEERQRDVWNEASAVGMQVATWSSLVAGVVAVWVGGAPAMPYAVTLVGIGSITSVVTLAYAKALGVDAVAAEGARVLRWRLVPMILLLVAFAAGMLRASTGEGFLHGASVGACVGVALGLGALALVRWRASRQEH